ncbi:transposase family protein, partial [Bacillus spongiae]
MLSLSLDLPEFKVVKQENGSNFHFVVVEKKCEEERCPYCGFLASSVHDRRTRKVRDLALLHKPLYLFIRVRRFRCHNCLEVFSETYDSVKPGCHQTSRFREYLYEQ